jgi:hypothetical protein
MPHKDPVTPELRYAVMKRDHICVGAKIGMGEACGSQFGSGSNIVWELDHVDNAGLGRRGPSTMDNLVLICGYHHRVKTESSKTWRPKLREYLDAKSSTSVSGGS